MRPFLTHRCLLLVAIVSSMQAKSADLMSAPGVVAETRSPIFALSHGGKWAAFVADNDDVLLSETASGSTTRLEATGGGRPQSLAWQSDDRTLVVLRGQTLSLIDPLTGREVRAITSEVPLSALELSPDGRYASVIADHRIELVDLADGTLRFLSEAGTPDVLAGEVDPVFAAAFKIDRHYVWSPDSQSVVLIETAFCDHAHTPLAGAVLPTVILKRVDLKSGSAQTIVKSDDEWPYLFRLSWSPDGRQLAYYRMNRLQTSAELRTFDGVNSKTLFAEQDAYWVTVPATPRFLTDGQSMIVTSERSGANHIYRYYIASGKFQDLTPQDCNVYSILSITDAPQRIYASGTAGDKQNMHLFEIQVGRGTFRQLTTEPGWHDAVVDDRGNGFLDHYSSAKQSPTLIWHSVHGAPRQLFKTIGDAPTLREQSSSFSMHDDTAIPARWLKPTAFDSHRKYPVIVAVSSGPDGSAAQNDWGGWPMALNRLLLEHGYVVLALDTRGTRGYGHLFEEYIHTRLGAQEVADIREVYEQLRRLEFVDPDRIGIWGTGYGGFIAVEALLDIHQAFKAGFAHTPVIDWRNYPAYFSERYLGLPQTNAFSYIDSMATKDARRIGGTLMVAQETPQTVVASAQIDAFNSAVVKIVAKRPRLEARFRAVTLGSATGTDASASHHELLDTMTGFFDSLLKPDSDVTVR